MPFRRRRSYAAFSENPRDAARPAQAASDSSSTETRQFVMPHASTTKISVMQHGLLSQAISNLLGE
jgi:hypothetical protein